MEDAGKSKNAEEGPGAWRGRRRKVTKEIEDTRGNHGESTKREAFGGLNDLGTCVCAHVFAHVGVCVCAYVCVCVYVFSCLCLFVCMCICMYVYMHVHYMYAHLWLHMFL